MVSGDTAVDDAESGYRTAEKITLSTFPTGSAYSWGQAIPAGSAVASSGLSSKTAATPTFTPDVAGEYVITCDVDGTAYVLRLTVTSVIASPSVGSHRYMPAAEAGVIAPSTGETLFFSKEKSRLVVKDSAGVVRDWDASARTGTFTLSSGAATIADTSITATTTVLVMCTAASNRGTLVWTITAGVDAVVASSDGSDGSTYRYVLIG